MRFYRNAEWLTYFVPMPLLSSVKCQAWKNSIYTTVCERITSMYNRVCQDFDWALRGTGKRDQNTASALLQKQTLIAAWSSASRIHFP